MKTLRTKTIEDAGEDFIRWHKVFFDSLDELIPHKKTRTDIKKKMQVDVERLAERAYEVAESTKIAHP
jgi:Tfp pilus assembly protein PilN